MVTPAQVAYPWQNKVAQRVSSCWALIVGILAASLIGTAITLLVLVTLG